ncbi:hypothetical protein F383_23890 [Gossypium arboreum]
MNSLT